MARIIEPPARLPRRFGLFSAAQVVEDETLDSVRFRPSVVSDGARAWQWDCPMGDLDAFAKEAFRYDPWVENTPFVVLTGIECTPVGVTAESLDAASMQTLLAKEETVVEQVVMTGETENGRIETRIARNAVDNTTPGVSHRATVVLAGGAAQPRRYALGLLQDWIAEVYGGVGVIHVPRESEPYVPDLRVEGQNLVSRVGNLVVAGAGYAGTSPNDVEPAERNVWWYVTAPVVLRRGPARMIGDFASSMNRGTNTATRLVERAYVASWDLGESAGVLVDLDL